MKNIYCIRHGKALHNVLFPLIGNIAYESVEYKDTNLVDEGINQALKIGQIWQKKKDIEVVFVSPLTRCIETANHIFGDTNVKMIAIEEIIEYSQGIENCNLRKNKSKLKKLYENIDFSLLDETPKYWKENRMETFKELKERDIHFKNFLHNRPEKNIAIVSHSTYLKHFLFNYVDNVDNELKHCYPFQVKLNEIYNNEKQQNLMENTSS